MSSETNVQLFPGVFRTTQGGTTNPDFFLHSSGRVGIGNQAPDTPPAWNTNTTFKLNVTGHTHIDGNLDVTGYLYGDGSTLSGVAAVIGGYWDLDQANNDIKYDVGNVGIGGAAGTNKLKVHGTVEATSFSGIQVSDVPDLSANKITTDTLDAARIPTLSTSKISGLANSATIEATTEDTANRIAMRNQSGDIFARLFRSDYQNQNDCGAAIAFRNSTTDNYIRFCSEMSAVRSRLGLGFLSTVSSYPTVTQGDFRWQYGGTGNISHANYGGYGDWYIRSNNGLGKVIIQDTGGRVGIGTSSPEAALHVASSYLISINNYAKYSSSTNSPEYWPTPYFNFDVPTATSIYAERNILAPAFYALSDMRIKENIVDVVDHQALDLLRQLKPKKYQYKDKVSRGSREVFGFLAQDVEEVLPECVNKRTEPIPNILELASVSESNVITFNRFDTSNLVSNVSTLEVVGATGGRRRVEIVDVIDTKNIKVDTDLSDVLGSLDETGNLITETITTTLSLEEYEALAPEEQVGFTKEDDTYTKTITKNVGSNIGVYGEVVDDFLSIDKNYIWTIATSALQEVDRQLQAEKEKVKSLEERLAALEAIVLNQ